MLEILDYAGRRVRLTGERRDHILEHPELATQFALIYETLVMPEMVVATPVDESVHVYHRHYDSTPVTSKYLLVVVKQQESDAFVPTAFFSSRLKKGRRTWPA
jgi:hypothetical protein